MSSPSSIDVARPGAASLAKMRICELEDEQFSHHFKSAVLPIDELHLWKGRGRGSGSTLWNTLSKCGCRQGISGIHRRTFGEVHLETG